MTLSPIPPLFLTLSFLLLFPSHLAAAKSPKPPHPRAIAKAFLEDNQDRPGVITTKSGLQYEVLHQSGSTEKAHWRDSVILHFHGTLIDGTVFESSLASGLPAKLPLEGLIPGWTEGIKLMSPGDKYRFYLPSHLGYGSSRVKNIPPHSVLIFEIELLEIVPKKKRSSQ